MDARFPPFDYCPGCGRSGTEMSAGKRIHCPACGFVYFQNAATAVAVVFTVGSEIMMTRRAHDPAAGLLDFPGGFVDPGESMEAAVVREIEEELGLRIPPDAPTFLFSNANAHYVYREVRYTTCDAYFRIVLSERPEVQVADDVAAIEWLQPDRVEASAIAFDSVRNALGRLRAAPAP